MQATARLKYLMMSPRKVRRVVTLVKGKSVDEALSILKFTNKAAAAPLAKTIQSATANALAVEGTSRIKAEDLSIALIQVDEGPRAKRIRFRAMGRVFRYKKRFAHLTVVVEGDPQVEAPSKKQRATKKKDVQDTVKPAKEAGSKAKAAAKKKTTKKAVKKPAAKKTAAKKTAAPKADAKTKKAKSGDADEGEK